jgi:hypothetical protein
MERNLRDKYKEKVAHVVKWITNVILGTLKLNKAHVKKLKL